uniref:Ribosomal protein S19 n=1 Tax=Proteomonas sulcata TaxID=77928 RepID=A0A2P1G8D0_9CRYP|nr:ribosomal protein S19 [Proteomonas sulcata]AVM81193.1 ribosomal protein S19 [Proteomonas sulcata]
MRSTWKGPFFDLNQIKKTETKWIQTASRKSVIFPSFIGLSFNISNGKNLMNITVTEAMVGHKFGEFIITKKISTKKK